MPFTHRRSFHPPLQLEALQQQLVAAEQQRLELVREVEQLRAMGVQQVRGRGLPSGRWGCCCRRAAGVSAAGGIITSEVAALPPPSISWQQEMALSAATTHGGLSPFPASQASDGGAVCLQGGCCRASRSFWGCKEDPEPCWFPYSWVAVHTGCC